MFYKTINYLYNKKFQGLFSLFLGADCCFTQQ
jgi:hypothetical protein